MQKFKPDFIALVTYLLPEDGGRQWPVHSGYKPLIKFDGNPLTTYAENTFYDRAEVHPGITAEANITLDLSDLFTNNLSEGQTFNLFQQKQHIGTGIITKIINRDLYNNARTLHPFTHQLHQQWRYQQAAL
jgi:translation elongation factor EF-Tu-like GTPase